MNIIKLLKILIRNYKARQVVDIKQQIEDEIDALHRIGTNQGTIRYNARPKLVMVRIKPEMRELSVILPDSED